MSIVTYKEFEFDLEKLKEQDKCGKLKVWETINSHIMLDGLSHNEIIDVFEDVKQTALSKGFPDYKIVEEIEEYSDYPIWTAVCERDETDKEFEERLLKAAHKKKKQQIAAQNRAKAKKEAKKLKQFSKFYDNLC